MTGDEIHAHCLAKMAVTDGYPFGPGALVYKVAGKMFALVGLPDDPDQPLSLNLKCEPEFAVLLRDSYEAVIPGYHMNKKHWNTVVLDGSIPPAEILGWIDDSYDLVVDNLPKRSREHIRRADR